MPRMSHKATKQQVHERHGTQHSMTDSAKYFYTLEIHQFEKLGRLVRATLRVEVDGITVTGSVSNNVESPQAILPCVALS